MQELLVLLPAIDDNETRRYENEAAGGEGGGNQGSSCTRSPAGAATDAATVDEAAVDEAAAELVAMAATTRADHATPPPDPGDHLLMRARA